MRRQSIWSNSLHRSFHQSVSTTEPLKDVEYICLYVQRRLPSKHLDFQAPLLYRIAGCFLWLYTLDNFVLQTMGSEFDVDSRAVTQLCCWTEPVPQVVFIQNSNEGEVCHALFPIWVNAFNNNDIEQQHTVYYLQGIHHWSRERPDS